MNVQAAQGGVLTVQRIASILSDAETLLRGVFPEYSKKINVSPLIDTESDFAGYELSIDGHVEIASFDFGEQGIDIA